MRIKLAAILLWIGSYAYATDQDTVTNWTQNLLLTTLSASYNDTPSKIRSLQNYYLPSAWVPMQQFLFDKRIEINTKMLTLHPHPLTSPQIIDQNTCQITPCWQVVQSFNIPELQLNIAISLLVIPGDIVNGSEAPFVVQSASIDIGYY